MSLRPRYSLLTLLLLTAAVAGGIKLWRGPHRVVLTKPEVREMAGLDHVNSSLADEYFMQSGKLMSYEYECTYLNTWGVRKLLTLQFNYTEPRPVLRQISFGGEPFFHLSRSPPEYMTDHPDLSSGEAICWISGKLELVSNEPFKTEDRPDVHGLNWMIQQAKRRMYGPAYLITNRKLIFRTKLYDFSPEYFEKIELDDIPDLAVRTQVQSVLAALPDQ